MLYKGFLVVALALIGFGVWNMLDYKAAVEKARKETEEFTATYVPPPSVVYIDATVLCSGSDLEPEVVDWCVKYPERRSAWEKAHPKQVVAAQNRAKWEESHSR